MAASSIQRRVVGEFAATLAALAAVSLYMQLRDPLSPGRLWISEQLDTLRASLIRQRVEQFINSASREES